MTCSDLQGLPGRVEAFPEDGDGTLAAARGNRDGHRMSKNVKEHEGTGICVFFFHEMDEMVEFFSDIGCCQTEFIGSLS